MKPVSNSQTFCSDPDYPVGWKILTGTPARSMVSRNPVVEGCSAIEQERIDALHKGMTIRMAIPDYQPLMLPVLKLASDGEEHKFSKAVEELAAETVVCLLFVRCGRARI